MSQELKLQYCPTVPVAGVPMICHTHRRKAGSEGKEVRVTATKSAHKHTEFTAKTQQYVRHNKMGISMQQTLGLSCTKSPNASYHP